MNNIACVTGASGAIGRRIADRILARGWSVRALTRKGKIFDDRIQAFKGDLRDAQSLKYFLQDATALFHCAAELENVSVMWEVNVEGTRRLMDAAGGSGLKYLCHISSAGVTGNVEEKLVDETTECHPYNLYEKSKWAAEGIVVSGIEECKVVILRPTNVVDEENPGVMSLMRGGWKNRIKLFIKGGECAHVVHADDVAAAAIYLMDLPAQFTHTLWRRPCYFISCDHEPMNTYAGVRMLYEAYRNQIGPDHDRMPAHIPIFVTHAIRRLLKGKRNVGDVRYSSEKLLSTGFKYVNGLHGAIRRIAESDL